MRVVIDATPVLLRSAGVKNYLYHWLEHLRRAGGYDTFRAYPFIGQPGALTHEASVFSRLPTYARIAMLHFGNIPGNPALDLVLNGADIFHASNQIKNPPRKPRLTATIHDMTCWIAPELHTEANVKADRRFADTLVRKASGIITVSEHTRSDLLRLVDIAPEKVTAIYPGVPDRYFEKTAPYALAKPYILYVGTVEPRKNLDALLDGYKALRADLREHYDLVIAGPVGWAATETMARIRSAGAGVRYLGYVPERDMPALTGGASVFVYPSLYEGFGFPVAQAMAAGVPIVTSAISSLPEIAGEAALLIDPRSTAEIRNAVERLLDHPKLAASLGSKGRERASSLFRWERCAKESIEFFQQVISRA